MQPISNSKNQLISSWQLFIDKLEEEVIVVNDQHQVVLANESAKKRFGIHSMQSYKYSCKKFYGHFCEACENCPVNETLQNQKTSSFYFEKAAGKGYEVTSIILPTELEHEQWVMCTLKQTRSHKESKEKSQSVSDVGNWQVKLDESLRVVQTNQYTFQFLGLTKQTLEKNKPLFTDLLAPEYENAFIEIIKAIKNNKDTRQLRLLVNRRDNSYYGGNAVIGITNTGESTYYELRISPISYPEFGSKEYYDNLRLQNFIYIITQQMVHSQTISEGYRNIIYSIAEVLEANVCGFLHRGADKQYQVDGALVNGRYYFNDHDPTNTKDKIRALSSFLKQDDHLIISAVSSSEHEIKESLSRLKVESFISYPLKHQNRTVGYIFIGLPNAFVWPESRIDFVKIIGSIILQNLLQQETREKLKRLNENFINIFDNSSDAVFIVSLNGQILEANQTSTVLTGYNKRELLKKNVSEISKAETLDLAQVQYEMLQSQQMIFGTELIPRKGEKIPVETREKMIRYQGRLAILVIARDVRHRREINRMMVQTISETQDKERKRIAEGLHDNVGPLLSTLRIYIDLLRNTELVQQEIEDYSNKMNEIINEAIDTVREVSRNLMPGVLNDFGLKEAVSDFCNKINQTGVIRVYFKYSLDNTKLEDNLKNVIYSLIKELINNSIKHAQASEIELRIHENAEGLQVEVIDNGIGIDIERQISKSYKGLGLKNILSKVNANSGKVTILDVDGFGLRIVFPTKKISE
ncbi:MAG TPA: PAS domain S-box protein [Salinivirga sp.]|uniref:PAS domain S-box protein n=1 Tax=Salinivirga sp. TaxID=1970192 RepID=UPI002B48D6EC|nr:PAS domain S-box protein [Salinivirga sp.]HKK59015.1 PAS domain S-box protein [Salinivirga sp.]